MSNRAISQEFAPSEVSETCEPTAVRSGWLESYSSSVEWSNVFMGNLLENGNIHQHKAQS
jgi:hypothetical protein